MTSQQIMKTAVKALDSKKGIEIRAIGVKDITPIADYIVFASGGSQAQVNALSEETQYKLGELGVKPHHIEGKTGWLLLDYPGVIVNVLDVKSRDFYGLERLWADGEEVDISAIVNE